jgi:CRP-like cAMP-binding protein
MGNPLQEHLRVLLGDLPPEAADLASGARERKLSPGESLLLPDAVWRNLWWIERGCLRMYYLDRNGRESNKNFFVDDELLWPITPALAGESAGFHLEAVAACTLWELPWAAWQHAMERHPAWIACERRALLALLDEKMRREREFLQRSATERYVDLIESRPDWAERIPLRHIASFLGITDVALSRIRRRLNQG